MAVQSGMFIFELAIEKLTCYIKSKTLVLKADFADVFSLELKDPSSMHIVIPDPPPPPPDPPGKKKKKPPKPKKGKKGKEPPPPPEPRILVGQSILFSSSPEFMLEKMQINPLEVSVWSKDDKVASELIGAVRIAWDPVFLSYLSDIFNCKQAPAPTVNDEYNVFEEGVPKIIAKVRLNSRLVYMTDRICSSFRSLTEDPAVRKYLYTGMNSKTTSYLATLKTSDEQFQENWEKFREKQKYYKDRVFPTPGVDKKPAVFASYENAPGAKMSLVDETDIFCCKGFSDKPPSDKYEGPEALPDIDSICEYIRKIITSCNANMRMLTPRPTIRPRIRATDMDKLCYCKETNWPQGELGERFRIEAQGGPCPVCVRELDGKERAGTLENPIKTFEIAKITGPCGRHDCKIARELRGYIQQLVDEDNKEINLDEIIGPCGSKTCTLVDRIQDFLRHRGPFSHEAAADATKPGLTTQCACKDILHRSFLRKGSCESLCSFDCENHPTEYCGGKLCPYKKSSPTAPSPNDSSSDTKQTGSTKSSPKSSPKPSKKVYQVMYFTVEYDQASSPSSKSPSKSSSKTGTQEDVYKYCAPACPAREEDPKCSPEVCPPAPKYGAEIGKKTSAPLCVNPVCPRKETDAENQKPRLSPADSKLVIVLKDIKNPCCVKSCDVAEQVKDLIVKGWTQAQKPKSCLTEDPCYCDCTCTFKMTGKTTYCPLCGGYEFLGDDMREMPEFAQPHPCPVYHKLYNRNKIKTISPWPHENKVDDNIVVTPKNAKSTPRRMSTKSIQSDQTKVKSNVPDTQIVKQVAKKIKKKMAKPATQPVEVEKRRPSPTGLEPVPRTMGWNWKAKDIPGMKQRPKWRPGAANKILVRRYRAVREGVDIIAKKKRALLSKKKKLEMKPTLVVKKKDGEYTVQMEVFKKYSKDRLLFQYPYEEKPPLIYTIGKTDETKVKIQKQRERRERRETRRKNRLLQSTFRDKCQEICLKAYNQSIGLLPPPNPNFPECPCDVPAVKPLQEPIIDSCSCSESGSISSSDTDGDEWIIEFTPPLATWDQKAKHPPTLTDSASQYTYLDYKVKIPDRFGYSVPRYFTGPDGKRECSDLGGFWGPGHKWLEINSDQGYVACDNRWVPQSFIGPDGQQYSSDEGFFQDSFGNSYKIGVDGFVDLTGKWCFYPNRRRPDNRKSASTVAQTAAGAARVPPPAPPPPPAPSAKSPPAQAAASQKKPVATSTTDTKQQKKTTFRTNKGITVMNVSSSNQWLRRKAYSMRQELPRTVLSNSGQKKWLDGASQKSSIRSSVENLLRHKEQIMTLDSELRPPMKTSRACSTHQVVSPAPLVGRVGAAGAATAAGVPGAASGALRKRSPLFNLGDVYRTNR